MGLAYENLDDETRRLMVEEIDMDRKDQSMYISNYLNESGVSAWPDLTREAARVGSDDSLANELSQGRLLKTEVQRRKPSGGFTTARVPVTAAETLSEAQFNLYYMRVMAVRASTEGMALQVYRAKAVASPRSSSEALIHTLIDPLLLLEELRRTKGVEPSVGMPLPNSGLCIRLVPQ